MEEQVKQEKLLDKEGLSKIPSIWDELPDKILQQSCKEEDEDYLDEGFISDCWSGKELFKMRKTLKECKCVVCRKEFILEWKDVCNGMRRKSLTDEFSRYVYVCLECLKLKDWRAKWRSYNKERFKGKDSVLNWQRL